jgi:hypothetical protein
MASLKQQFEQLQFELVNTTTGLNQFIVNGGSSINELQFTIVNQGTESFPWKGNALDIHLSNFLTKEQIQKVIVKDPPTGWSGAVVHEPGYLPHTGTYVLRLQPTSSDMVQLEVNESLTFKFEQINVTDPPLTTGSWIDVSLHPSHDTAPHSIIFFTATKAFVNQKNVTVQWPDYEGNIYISGEEGSPIINQRQFEIYNNSSNPLDPNWQSSGKSPVFVVAFQPGLTENCVASEDFIQAFSITLADPDDPSKPMWTIKKQDTIGSSGTIFWEIKPTTNNKNILDGNESLKLYVALQSDAHNTAGQYSHAYMYVNQVDIGTTQLHQLPIYKLQVPSLSMTVSDTSGFKIMKEEGFRIKVNWAITDNPNNLSHHLTIIVNKNNKLPLLGDKQSGVESVYLHQAVNTLELKLELTNPNYTVSKTAKVNIKGVAPNVFDLREINPTGGDLTVYSVAPYLNLPLTGPPAKGLSSVTSSVKVSDNKGNSYTIPISQIGGKADPNPCENGATSVWYNPNSKPIGYATKMSYVPNAEHINWEIEYQNGFWPVMYSVKPFPVGVTGIVVNNEVATLFFDNNVIRIGPPPSKGIPVPNAPLNFDHSFMRVENASTGEDDLLILIKNSAVTTPNQWIAYSQKDKKFLSWGGGSGYIYSLPTWKDEQLIFVSNNPSSNAWGLYYHDFSNPDNPQGIAPLGNFGKNNHILQIEYLSEPNYLLMLDMNGVLWVADCANDYALLSTDSTANIWKTGSYPSEFKQAVEYGSGAFLVSDGRCSAAIYRQEPYHTFLTAQFY